MPVHAGPRGRPHRRRSTCSRRSPTGSPATSIPTRSPSTSSGARRRDRRRQRRPAARAIAGIVAHERLVDGRRGRRRRCRGACATSSMSAASASRSCSPAATSISEHSSKRLMSSSVRRESVRHSIHQHRRPAQHDDTQRRRSSRPACASLATARRNAARPGRRVIAGRGRRARPRSGAGRTTAPARSDGRASTGLASARATSASSSAGTDGVRPTAAAASA